MSLASIALTGDALAAVADLKNAIQAGETKHIPLKEPLPVYVLYWTAFADPDGTVHFRPDAYKRDSRLQAALPPKIARGQTFIEEDCGISAG